MNYEHYIIDQQYQTDSSKTMLPKLISSKKIKIPNDAQKLFWQPTQLLWFCPKFFIHHILRSSDPRTLFYNQEKEYKIEKYIKILELTFQQLYESKFEKEEHNLFPSKTYLWTGLYGMIHIIINLGMLFILMGTGYIQQITSRIQNVKIKRV